MDNLPAQQFVVVTEEAPNQHRVVGKASFWNEDGTPYEGLPTDASGVDYDNEDSELAAEDVQAAIDEVVVAIEAQGTQISDLETSSNVFPLVTTATAIDTAAKTTTSDEPAANTLVPIKFTNGNSADTPTVAFDGGDPIDIVYNGTAVDADDFTLAANAVVMFYFDGTDLHLLAAYPV